ncbi:hypothetical protein [Sinorhizobium fredii]|uniref:hypothetical protein n=1 Tax=Rhizobium fredii TaxID=380 RepID=UPI0005B301B0|nr:hypothetical protein [Sinorhizobium fredii]
MKFPKAKKKHPGKVHKIGREGRSDHEGLYANNRSSHGFSYRGQWMQEGCPGPFEAWLVNKGVISSSDANGSSRLKVML